MSFAVHVRLLSAGLCMPAKTPVAPCPTTGKVCHVLARGGGVALHIKQSAWHPPARLMRTVVRSLASRSPESRGGKAMGSSPHMTVPSGAEAMLRGGETGRGPIPVRLLASRATNCATSVCTGRLSGGPAVRLATSGHERMRRYTKGLVCRVSPARARRRARLFDLCEGRLLL